MPGYGTQGRGSTRQKAGRIRGVVKSDNFQPVVEAQVVIVKGPPRSDVPDLAALTGSDGRFAFGDLPPGDYVLKVYARQGESEAIEAPVLPGKTAFVEVWLESAEPIPEEESHVVDEL